MNFLSTRTCPSSIMDARDTLRHRLIDPAHLLHRLDDRRARFQVSCLSMKARIVLRL
jgi:hypothetical protein